jgi:hypothetical protein
MIKTFEQYEQKPHTFTFMVGIPSGEYFDITTDQYVKLNRANLIIYDNQHQYFVFQDHNYDKVMDIMLDTEADKIKLFLQRNNITNYKINNDYTIEVLQNVEIVTNIRTLPVDFDFVLGNFNISNCELEDLRGCPDVIEGDFICTNNNLIDLRNGPRKVKGMYIVENCGLINLEGSPDSIGGIFNCGKNEIINLKDGPKKVGGNYYCDNCLLTDLTGAPIDIKGNFDCSYNYLKNLKGGPKTVVGIYDCSNNDLKGMEGAPSSVHVFKCNGNRDLILDNPPQAIKIISDEK